MKFSEAMLKGFERTNGRQCTQVLSVIDERGTKIAVCAIGSVTLGSNGDLSGWRMNDGFTVAWGLDMADLNDEGMPWEHIYGMAVAAGL